MRKIKSQIKEIIQKYGLQQFIRFCIVGVLCTIVDALLFYLIRNFLSYEISLATGYLSALIVNYILTIRWTFKSNPSVKNALGITFVHLINLFIIRMGLMYIFVDILFWADKIAYLPTLCISVIVNFIMMKSVINCVSFQNWRID